MIHRDEHSDGYVILSNSLIRDTRLSDGAFRLLMFMLSMSDDWHFSVKGLAYTFGVTERVIKYRIKELRKFGYIELTKVQNKSGHFGEYIWDVYERPRGKKSDFGTEVQNTEVQKTEGQNFSPIRITNTKEIPNIEEIPKHKHILGSFQNVFLTDSEQKELCDRWGFDDVIVYIDRLSIYLHEHPEKKYKNHKTTIEKWIIQDKERKAI